MIEQRGDDVFVLFCDKCKGESTRGFDTFMGAVDYMRDKRNGWRAVKDKFGDWQDLCPSCSRRRER